MPMYESRQGERATSDYWRNLADYDLETAEVMSLRGRYLYVGFMCHQATERILKAIYTEKRN